ncbi:hypothetical protein [Nocardia acidivorans]|uniref:hypothetical protein n=1 Tax=Nocardia acidivorans TaxID=404580 RepID=UPI0012FB99BA|nr:hypothetical protein [Nocardia acidivorans]
MSEHGTFGLSGFLPFTGFSTHVARYEAVVALVHAAGYRVASVLYALDKEYAPYYRATCDRSYCRSHWNLNAVFDYGFDYRHVPVRTQEVHRPLTGSHRLRTKLDSAAHSGLVAATLK